VTNEIVSAPTGPRPYPVENLTGWWGLLIGPNLPTKRSCLASSVSCKPSEKLCSRIPNITTPWTAGRSSSAIRREPVSTAVETVAPRPHVETWLHHICTTCFLRDRSLVIPMRKSGVAQWKDLQFSLPAPMSDGVPVLYASVYELDKCLGPYPAATPLLVEFCRGFRSHGFAN